jgi:protein pelota
MRQLYINLGHGEIKLQAENPDDLWVLSQVIDSGDLVSGKTVRKIKIGEDDQRSVRITKKQVYVTLAAEKIELDDSLRISGKITAGPDDVSRGVYHTLSVEQGTTVAITKEHWLSYQLDKVKEACKSKPTSILVCVMDREEAYFAKLKTQGYDLIAHIQGEVQKKAGEQKIQKDFYTELAKSIAEYDRRYLLNHIILASPSFWKEELLDRIKEKALKEKVILATCSSVTTSGINEVLRRPEVRSALHEERLAEEIALVEELLTQIAKNALAAYGTKEVGGTVDAGAVKTLLITDRYLKEKREQGQFLELESMMRSVEQCKGKVQIISTEHEGGKKLQGLGGIAALLRYKVNV